MKRLVPYVSFVFLFSASSILLADNGKATYSKACQMCHGSGAAGAPKVGNKFDWSARLEKGIAELETNAIKGFRGKRGYMPPKGGYPKLDEEDVKSAVAYMVSASK